MDSRLYSWSSLEEDHPIPLLHRRVVSGDKAMIARVRLERGCQVPTHRHDCEQIAYVVSGRILWHTGEEGHPARTTREMTGGDVMVVPSNVPHGVEALEETEILDIMSPPGPMGVDRMRAHG